MAGLAVLSRFFGVLLLFSVCPVSFCCFLFLFLFLFFYCVRALLPSSFLSEPLGHMMASSGRSWRLGFG